MEEALAALLLADAGVSAQVGARVYWSELPQGKQKPAIVLHRASGLHGYTVDGADGLVESRIQADAWGESYGAAKLAARAVKTALTGYSGTQSGITFQGAFVNSETDGHFDEGSEKLYRTMIDLTIWHTE